MWTKESAKAYSKQWYKSHAAAKIADVKVRRKADPDKYRNIELKKWYGITLDDKRNMFDKQDGKCAICSTNFIDFNKAHVDHNHITKKVRGLLCRNCNLVLGHAQDNFQVLQKAALYLTTRDAA